MSIKDISLRPVCAEDVKKLNEFREKYFDADIEIPYGYSVPGSVETAVAEKSGDITAGMTATKVVVFDLAKNPNAKSVDVFASALMLERALAYIAQQGGMTTAYIAIPSHLHEYLDMVKRCGYEEGFQGCTILRRSLRQETEKSIAESRDVPSQGDTAQ